MRCRRSPFRDDAVELEQNLKHSRRGSNHNDGKYLERGNGLLDENLGWRLFVTGRLLCLHWSGFGCLGHCSRARWFDRQQDSDSKSVLTRDLYLPRVCCERLCVGKSNVSEYVVSQPLRYPFHYFQTLLRLLFPSLLHSSPLLMPHLQSYLTQKQEQKDCGSCEHYRTAKCGG